jgi:hypothetical protein
MTSPPIFSALRVVAPLPQRVGFQDVLRRAAALSGPSGQWARCAPRAALAVIRIPGIVSSGQISPGSRADMISPSARSSSSVQKRNFHRFGPYSGATSGL